MRPEDLAVKTAKSAAEAAELACARCTSWTREGENGAVTPGELRRSAAQQDAESRPDPADPRCCYIVSPDGAVGMTRDAGRSVRWLFAPGGKPLSELPPLLDLKRPWPLPLHGTARYCPRCGKRVRTGSRFCGACGYKLPEE